MILVIPPPVSIGCITRGEGEGPVTDVALFSNEIQSSFFASIEVTKVTIGNINTIEQITKITLYKFEII